MLEQAERAEEGGGLEFVTVANEGEEPMDLGGYELAPVDPEPGSSISIGRGPDVQANGEQVNATFSGEASLDLQSGDRLALIDPEGSVVTTITL